MKPTSKIVDGGGWITHETVGKPKARLFGFLSFIWAVVLMGVSIPFWYGLPTPLSPLDWIGLSLIVPEPVLIVLAIAFWIGERPRTIIERRPNPDYDVRNLY